MSFALIVPVQESLSDLKNLLKTVQPIFVPRIKMLIEIKKEDNKGVSKRELMNRIGASSQSIHNWRTMYKQGGLERLLSHNKKGFKPSVLTEEEHQRLSILLQNPNNDIKGFVALQQWVKTEFNKDVKYNTLLKYCSHHFGVKTKFTRKSHTN